MKKKFFEIIVVLILIGFGALFALGCVTILCGCQSTTGPTLPAPIPVGLEQAK